jgi:hypothetical protein
LTPVSVSDAFFEDPPKLLSLTLGKGGLFALFGNIFNVNKRHETAFHVQWERNCVEQLFHELFDRKGLPGSQGKIVVK